MIDKNKVLILKDFSVPSTPGIHYRLLCLTGKGKGQSIFLRGDRILLGRGEHVDVKIEDEKCSREQAELKRMGPGFVLTDLRSANGTFVNDVQITQKMLADGDMIVIGKTVLKYARIEVKDSQAEMSAESKSDAGVNVKAASKGRGRLLLIVIVLGLASWLFIFGDETGALRGRRAETVVTRDPGIDLISHLKNKEREKDTEIKDKLETLYRSGLREYREGNYFRAMSDFNLALILKPDDSIAQFYMDKTRKGLDRDIQENFNKANRESMALKYPTAIVWYCSIIRLLKKYPCDRRHCEARKKINELEEKLGLDKNETDCLRELIDDKISCKNEKCDEAI
jgi:pSer/pThr/pTyr-binding forkhead associated (FHA) protein